MRERGIISSNESGYSGVKKKNALWVLVYKVTQVEI